MTADLIGKYPTKTYGEKYAATKDLDVAEIAKLMRADIKAAVSAGTLPAGAKYSVKISRYSMGRSIDIRMSDHGFVARDYVTVQESWGPRRTPRYTAEAQRCLDILQAISDAYNYDGSDIVTDYFDVRFYGQVAVLGEIAGEEQ